MERSKRGPQDQYAPSHARWGDGIVAETGILQPSFRIEGRAVPILPLSRYLLGLKVTGTHISQVAIGGGQVLRLSKTVPEAKTWHLTQVWFDAKVTAVATSARFEIGVRNPATGAVLRYLVDANYGALAVDATARVYLPVNEMIMAGEDVFLTSTMGGGAPTATLSGGFIANEYPAGIDKT